MKRTTELTPQETCPYFSSEISVRECSFAAPLLFQVNTTLDLSSLGAHPFSNNTGGDHVQPFDWSLGPEQENGRERGCEGQRGTGGGTAFVHLQNPTHSHLGVITSKFGLSSGLLRQHLPGAPAVVWMGEGGGILLYLAPP